MCSDHSAEFLTLQAEERCSETRLASEWPVMSPKVPSRKQGPPCGASGTTSRNSPEHLNCEFNNHPRLGKTCTWHIAMSRKYGAQETWVVIGLFSPVFRMETIFEGKLRNLTVWCGWDQVRRASSRMGFRNRQLERVCLETFHKNLHFGCHNFRFVFIVYFWCWKIVLYSKAQVYM